MQGVLTLFRESDLLSQGRAALSTQITTKTNAKYQKKPVFFFLFFLFFLENKEKQEFFLVKSLLLLMILYSSE